MDVKVRKGVKVKSVVEMVKVKGEVVLWVNKGSPKYKSTNVCQCLKANALISILFLLKLNQGILESPACCIIVQLSTREHIEKWVTERGAE